jgi:hypothetical protein
LFSLDGIPVNAKLASIDKRLKSLDPDSYGRWLLIPSLVTVLLLLPCVLVYDLDGAFRSPVVARIWMASIPLIVFSFVGLGTIRRTRHSVVVKLAFVLLHLASITLFLAPLFVFLWFVVVMRDH